MDNTNTYNILDGPLLLTNERKKQMKKKINGVLCDTASSSLIAETESTTALSGKLSLKLCTADYSKTEILPIPDLWEWTIIKNPGD